VSSPGEDRLVFFTAWVSTITIEKALKLGDKAKKMGLVHVKMN
jgi:hypothetical protein